MMKKKHFQILIAGVFIFLLIKGCGDSGRQPAAREDDSDRIGPLTIAHGAGAGGGIWYIAAEGVAQFIREQYPGTRVSAVTGSSDGNLARLQRGEVQLAVSAMDSADSAVKGEGIFSRPIPLEDVKAIARLYQARLHFVVASRLEIDSLEKIRENKIPLRISAGSRGSGMEKGARRILSEYGITFEDIENWGGRVVFVGHAESARMMGDGQINAMVALSAVPMSILTELATKRDFTILPIRKDIIEKMVEEFNYTADLIPADAYNGLAEDISTISITNGIFASGSMKDETAYRVTAALLDNLDRLRGLHSQLSDISPEFMNQPMVFSVHPGARRAYQDRERK